MSSCAIVCETLNFARLLSASCGSKEPKQVKEDPDTKLSTKEIIKQVKSVDTTEERVEKLVEILKNRLGEGTGQRKEGKALAAFPALLIEFSRHYSPMMPNAVPPCRNAARKYLIRDFPPSAAVTYVENLKSPNPLIQKEAKEALVILGKDALAALLEALNKNPDPYFGLDVFRELFKDENLLKEAVMASASPYETKIRELLKKLDGENLEFRKRITKVQVQLLEPKNPALIKEYARKLLLEFRNFSYLFKEMKGKSAEINEEITKIFIEADDYNYTLKCSGDESDEIANIALNYLNKWKDLFPAECGFVVFDRIGYFASIWKPEYKIRDPRIAQFAGLTKNPDYIKPLEEAFNRFSWEEVAATALVKFGGEKEVIDFLVKKLSSGNYSVREAALKALKQIAENTGQTLDVLIVKNWKPEYPIHLYEVAKALNCPQLQKKGISVCSFEREFAPAFIEALKRYPPNDICIPERICVLSKAESPLGYEIAAYFFYADADAVEGLLKILDEPPNDKVRNAAAVFVVARSTSFVPQLVERLQRFSYPLELLKLISARTKTSLDDLIANNWKADYTVIRSETAQALGNKSKKEFIPQLFAAVDVNNLAQKDVVKALNKMGEETWKHIDTLIAKGSQEDKLRVIKFITLRRELYIRITPSGEIRTSAYDTERLIWLLDDENEEVRNAAHELLFDVFEKEEEELIEEIKANLDFTKDKIHIVYGGSLNYDFKNEKPIRSYLILKAIEGLKGDYDVQFPFVKRLLLTARDYNENIHGPNALEAIAYSILVNPRKIPQEYFSDLLADKEADIKLRRLAAKFFGDIGSKLAIKELKQILGVGLLTWRDSDEELCRIAFESLKKIKEKKK